VNKTRDINPKLKTDTIELGELNGQTLLLLNNAWVPWFIVLPDTREIELFRLDPTERAVLDTNIDLLSALLIKYFAAEKLNVASIGNVVSQMHIHVVGRRSDDPYWPGVVWGQPGKALYQTSDILTIKETVAAEFGEQFSAA